MRYLKKFYESESTSLTIEDLDQIEDLFLSVADKLNLVEVEYPTVNHVFEDEDQMIYRIQTYFWNAGKTTILIDDDWSAEIQSIKIRVVALGWFESMSSNQGESHYGIPQDVYDVYSDLIDELDKFRNRLVKFGYRALPIKIRSDYYTELVAGEEITTEGISLSLEINSKL